MGVSIRTDCSVRDTFALDAGSLRDLEKHFNMALSRFPVALPAALAMATPSAIQEFIGVPYCTETADVAPPTICVFGGAERAWVDLPYAEKQQAHRDHRLAVVGASLAGRRVLARILESEARLPLRLASLLADGCLSGAGAQTAASYETESRDFLRTLLRQRQREAKRQTRLTEGESSRNGGGCLAMLLMLCGAAVGAVSGAVVVRRVAPSIGELADTIGLAAGVPIGLVTGLVVAALLGKLTSRSRVQASDAKGSTPDEDSRALDLLVRAGAVLALRAPSVRKELAVMIMGSREQSSPGGTAEEKAAWAKYVAAVSPVE